MIKVRVPNYRRIGIKVRDGMRTAAKQSATEDVTERTRLMRAGLAPDGSPQKTTKAGGRTPLVRTGKLSSEAGWVVRQVGDATKVEPSGDRKEAVQRLTRDGFKIIEIATATRRGGRKKVADIARRIGG